MKVMCLICERDDFPVTEQHGVDATARDHLRIFHPDEWFTVDWAEDGICIYPSAHPDGDR